MSSVAKSVRLGGRLLECKSPLVMAIINATPDSFFAESRAMDEHSLRQAFARAVEQGADIIDLGACSTRPTVQNGADGLVDEQQEWIRLSGALRIARQMDLSVPLSVDTFRPAVARQAIECFGVEMINDVSGGSEQMFNLVAEHNVAYVLTYNRSNALVTTDNVLSDALAFFSRKVDQLHRRGVSDVIIDPGFGFGQTVDQSLDLLANLSVLQHLDCPILVGISRKRMAYEPAGLTPETCLEQTLRLEQQAVSLGANILRVHDVTATCQMVNRKWLNSK